RGEAGAVEGLGGQLEDGHTLFDYNVGLNDIVQLLIRSESDAPTTSLTNEDRGLNPRVVVNCKNKVNQTTSGSSNQPSTSARSFLIDPGMGAYKVEGASIPEFFTWKAVLLLA
uniref:Ubiquitin-like domain-containing protein n=1 Tax=Sphenodon punctatus TaxID=8508 RepID=A0A8D0GGN8_SPHPU